MRPSLAGNGAAAPRLLLALAALGAAVGCGSGSSHDVQPSPGSLYMDVHDLGEGKVTAEAVAEAHAADLQVQDERGVRFLSYWVDEPNGKVYCLSHAPNAEAVIETHRQAHGLLPSTIGPVSEGH